MKKQVLILIFISIILMSAVSTFKWRQISDVVTTLTEINYLHGISGKPLTRSSADSIYNQISNNIDPHDSVWYKNETYHKDTIQYKLSKKANLYQPTLVSPTANTLPAGTNTTGLATTQFVYKERRSGLIDDMRDNGIAVLSIPMYSYAYLTGSVPLVSQRQYFTVLKRIYNDTICTGFKFVLSTDNGNYTASNYNGIGISRVNGSTTELLSTTADDPNLWKSGISTLITKNLPTPITLTAGLYAISLMYSSSAQVVAPTLLSFGSIYNSSNTTGQTFKVSSYKANSTVLESNINLESQTTQSTTLGIWIY